MYQLTQTEENRAEIYDSVWFKPSTEKQGYHTRSKDQLLSKWCLSRKGLLGIESYLWVPSFM